MYAQPPNLLCSFSVFRSPSTLPNYHAHTPQSCSDTPITLMSAFITSFRRAFSPIKAMAELNKEAASLIHSAAALKERAQKAGLSDAETQAILDNGVTSIAQMAFAITPPGTAFFAGRAGVNLGTVTSTKLLVFQCHTLVVANIKPEVGRKDDLSTHATLPAAERDRRIADQQKRLQGLRFRGDEEVAHSCYDQVFTILERDTLTYLHPEKFITRRTELLQKKPLKQLSLDNDSLTVKEKPSDHVCSTRTELELVAGFAPTSPWL